MRLLFICYAVLYVEFFKNYSSIIFKYEHLLRFLVSNRAQHLINPTCIRWHAFMAQVHISCTTHIYNTYVESML